MRELWQRVVGKEWQRGGIIGDARCPKLAALGLALQHGKERVR